MPSVVFLNTWGGSLSRPLLEFVRARAHDIDVFCFQEVFRSIAPGIPAFANPTKKGHRMFSLYMRLYDALLCTLHATHDGYFAPQMYKHFHDLETTPFEIQYGIAMFVRKTIPTIDVRSGMILREFSKMHDGKAASRAIQSFCLSTVEGRFIIAHFHGLWIPTGKHDTDERLSQSESVARFIQQQIAREVELSGSTPKVILGGDFNITSDSMSLRLLRHAARKDGHLGIVQNHLFGIHDTRTAYYPKEKLTREADFVITSYDVVVQHLEALETPVISDHRPLILKCS